MLVYGYFIVWRNKEIFIWGVSLDTQRVMVENCKNKTTVPTGYSDISTVQIVISRLPGAATFACGLKYQHCFKPTLSYQTVYRTRLKTKMRSVATLSVTQ